jgi:hypothetical protein
MNSRFTVQKEIGHGLAGSGHGAWKEDSKEETGIWKTEIKETWDGIKGR